MSAPSAGSQATRARDRAADELRARFESLEARYNSEIASLTDRVLQMEGELHSLRTSSTSLGNSTNDFRQRIVDLENSSLALDHSLQLIGAKLEVEESRMDVATADLEVIAPGLGNLEEIEVGDGGQVDRPPNPDASVQAKASEAARLSKEARDSEAVKEAVGKVLYGLYCVPNFKNIADKHYPHVPIEHEEWPHSSKPDGGRENHMRFDFEEPFNSATNLPSFERLVSAIRILGPARVAASRPYLEVLDEEDLRTRVKMRFDWERRSYLKAMKADGNTMASASGAANEATGVVLTEDQLAIMTTANRQSFQRTKVEARSRKRPNLAGEDEMYKAKKYDTVLTIGATSEDDYEVESINGHPPRKTGRVISREWWYASEELIKCKKAIDAVADPKAQTKKVATASIRGTLRPGSPRPNKVLATLPRRWMIRPEVLETNPHWVTDGRVLEDNAVTVPPTRSKRKAPTGPAENTAGPSDKGKQARLALQARRKTLQDKFGESAHGDAPIDD